MNTSTHESIPLITLVGPPNSGKTTLFNFLSGKNYKTVNYPGSTVEYSTSKFLDKFELNADLLDSPGIVSLNPGSPDEEVSVNSLYNHPKLGSPDLIIVTVDASQFTRHLFLAKQLLNSGFHVIIVLTMVDLINKRGFVLDDKILSSELNCDVIKIDARSGKGIDELVNVVRKNLEEIKISERRNPTKNYINSDKNELLKIYRSIEDVSEKVIKTLADVDGANKELTILNPVLKEAANRPDELTLKIDRIMLHKFWGIFVFFLIMAITFTSIFWIADPFMGLIDELFGTLSTFASSLLGNNWYGDLVSDGIINGTGAVLVFLPQILILFMILGLLEDSGYLARGAMIIDKPLSKIGLNGKSFVPMLSGFACSIPAMLAARTISNKRERLLTIFIIPLMSCSARLPVYALLIAFLTPRDKPWIGGIILASIYIFSIVSSLIAAAIINKFSKSLIRAQDNSSFILELPAYRQPKLSNVTRNSFESAKQYIFRAGPTILVLSMMIWFLTYFPNHSPEIPNANQIPETELISLQKVERLSSSYASDLGKFIQPIMSPLEMDWRIGVSLIAAFTAREIFVSSLALIFRVTDDEENLQSSILNAMKNARNEDTGKVLFTIPTIMGLIIFFVFALQCLSTVAVSKKETGGWRIPILQLIIFTAVAYIFTFITVNGMQLLGF